MDDEVKMMKQYKSNDGPSDDVHPVEVIEYGDGSASAGDSGE